jgi:hypothetical protein
MRLWRQRGVPDIWLATIFLLVCGVGAGVALWKLAPRQLRVDKLQPSCAPGPWGLLCYKDIVIEPPEGSIHVTALPTNATSWYLEALSPLVLKQRLLGCGLSEELAVTLQKSAVPATNSSGFLLMPPDDFVMCLAPIDRANLYGLLAVHTQNVAHTVPFRFELNTQKDWFDSLQLAPEIEALLRRLVYREGNMYLFSDLPLVLRRHPDRALYARLFRALSREVTMDVELHVTPSESAKDLAHYWGWPDREAEVATRIKTAQGVGPPHTVPLKDLLPAFPRERLNLYPSADDPSFSGCHYTTLNFFSQQPDLRFTSLTEVSLTLQRDYLEVPGKEYQLGDVILFMKKGEGVIHSCNYLAANLVFTKNGGSLIRPWRVARLDDLVGFYSYPKPVTLRVMRRRDLLKY